MLLSQTKLSCFNTVIANYIAIYLHIHIAMYVYEIV